MRAFLAFTAAAAFVASAAEGSGLRIVSGGAAITETIYALGAQDCLVAADISSVYPEEATKLPRVGYARQLAAEGILSVRPDLLLVNDDAGPPAVLSQIERAGVRVVRLPNNHTPEAAESRILQIGEALGKTVEATKLRVDLHADLEVAKARAESAATTPAVLFIYARGGGVVNVAGHGTAADSIIKLAGGVNAIQKYEGYKPLTAEAAAAAAPDFILVTSRGLESSGGVEELLKLPGLALTPAGKAKRVIAMEDSYLLGFGARLGQAAKELCDRLHPAHQETQR
ncbi:MAG TPA: hemin ABC transporter substrate-binding protein [Terrimicrobiaceae bacterium]